MIEIGRDAAGVAAAWTVFGIDVVRNTSRPRAWTPRRSTKPKQQEVTMAQQVQVTGVVPRRSASRATGFGATSRLEATESRPRRAMDDDGSASLSAE